jgi:hypothetical protein
MLGHASAAMTLDIYADLFDSDLDAVADHLDETRAAAKDHARAKGKLMVIALASIAHADAELI